jgi:DNA polymerase-3 subunit chi
VGEAFFYHLTRAPLEVTLRVLLEKSLAQPWRVAVRGRTDDMLDRLDGQLWLGDGFLPHGRAGGPHDADQPVLLTTGRRGQHARLPRLRRRGGGQRQGEVAVAQAGHDPLRRP